MDSHELFDFFGVLCPSRAANEVSVTFFLFFSSSLSFPPYSRSLTHSLTSLTNRQFSRERYRQQLSSCKRHLTPAAIRPAVKITAVANTSKYLPASCRFEFIARLSDSLICVYRGRRGLQIDTVSPPITYLSASRSTSKARRRLIRFGRRFTA